MNKERQLLMAILKIFLKKVPRFSSFVPTNDPGNTVVFCWLCLYFSTALLEQKFILAINSGLIFFTKSWFHLQASSLYAFFVSSSNSSSPSSLSSSSSLHLRLLRRHFAVNCFYPGLSVITTLFKAFEIVLLVSRQIDVRVFGDVIQD